MFLGISLAMNEIECARQQAMNARASAMAQSMNMGQGSLGGLYGMSGIGQAVQQQAPFNGYLEKHYPKPKTIREELQRDTDKWLEDVKL
jgi:hypothetical protein